MKDVHEYSPESDGAYDLDEMSYYLPKERLDSVIDKLGNSLRPEVIDFIRRAEELKMRCCKGELDVQTFNRACSSLEDSLVAKIGVWAYQTTTYQKVYQALSNG